jgi:hypothetical protein
MPSRFAVLLLVCLCVNPAVAQQNVRYKSAIVALTDDPDLRAQFETSLAVKAREHDYDAVTSYDLVPDVDDVSDRGFADTLAANGVQAVLMLRPAAIGAGSSLEAVRNEVSEDLYANMRKFAREVSSSSGDDLIAVVHMAIYTLTGGQPNLISAGAVWLDEPVENQTEGIARLQDLMLRNVDAVRPAIRQHLGLAPLQ